MRSSTLVEGANPHNLIIGPAVGITECCRHDASSNFRIMFTIEGPVEKAELLIDNQLLDTIFHEPWAFMTYMPVRGTHEVSVRVYDEHGHVGEALRTVFVPDPVPNFSKL